MRQQCRRPQRRRGRWGSALAYHGQEALDAIRSLIDRIEVRPGANAKGVEIELIGEIASMIRLGLAESQGSTRAHGSDADLFASSVKVVAGTGFEPVTFRL